MIAAERKADRINENNRICLFIPFVYKEYRVNSATNELIRGSLIGDSLKSENMVPGAGVEPARSFPRGIFLPTTAFAAVL